MKKFDIAIIGAGPVGLFCTYFAHLHGLKTVTFDSLKEVGGQPKFLYPSKKITDIPAFDQITGIDLIQRLKDAVSVKTTFVLNHRVTAIARKDNKFVVDSEYEVKSIIIATGTGAFTPKKFPVKMDQATEERIHYFVKDPTTYAGNTIAVFGGGDSALDWTLELAQQKNTKVKLIHRRNQFRGLESSACKLKSLKNVEILTPYLPKTITIRNNQLEIGLKQVGKTDIVKQHFDQIVVAYGFKADNSLAGKWGVNLINGQIKVAHAMTTNVPGIYAIGDCTSYPGRVPVIGLGFGEAQIAVTAIMRSLFPEKNLTIHSTSI